MNAGALPSVLQGAATVPPGGMAKALALSAALHASVLGAVHLNLPSFTGGAPVRALTVSLHRLPSAISVQPVALARRRSVIRAPAPLQTVAPEVVAAVSGSESPIVKPLKAHRVKARRLKARSDAQSRPTPRSAFGATPLAPPKRPAPATADEKKLVNETSASAERQIVRATTSPGAYPRASPTVEDGATRAPRPVSDNAPPRYPRLARRRGLEGRVVLTLEVNDAGRPQKMTVLKSSGVKMLDDAARDAVSRWRFEPALESGRAVPATVQVPVVFRLDRQG